MSCGDKLLWYCKYQKLNSLKKKEGNAHLVAQGTKGLENTKSNEVKCVSKQLKTVKTKDKNKKRSSLWFCEYNCPDYFLPKIPPKNQKLSIPPSFKKKSPKTITTHFKCPCITKPELLAVLIDPDYRFDCSIDEPYAVYPNDVFLSSSSSKETAILAAPPKSAFHFDFSCLDDFDKTSVDWSCNFT